MKWSFIGFGALIVLFLALVVGVGVSATFVAKWKNHYIKGECQPTECDDGLSDHSYWYTTVMIVNKVSIPTMHHVEAFRFSWKGYIVKDTSKRIISTEYSSSRSSAKAELEYVREHVNSSRPIECYYRDNFGEMLLSKPHDLSTLVTLLVLLSVFALGTLVALVIFAVHLGFLNYFWRGVEPASIPFYQPAQNNYYSSYS